jgi:endonuclease/exonuclease/phosphatase family metal-dependent hydrolase
MDSLRAAVGLCLLCLLLLPAMATGQELRVMTFNIRLASAKDGPNAWPLRRDLFFSTIEKFDPDLLGTQEVEPSQASELRERLKSYDLIGLPRTDGKTLGERSPVMFKRERFQCVRAGTFWLSTTPEVFGSKGWDAMLPRVCSWAELRDRKANGRTVFFFNTHWDHRGPQARAESAKLMRAKIAEIAGDSPTIVTGDFNTAAESAPHQTLVADTLFDAFAEANSKPTTRPFTFHGFTGRGEHAARIDWIIRSSAFATVSATIDRTNDNGRYPSDHFPVEAVLRWRENETTKPTK